MIRYLASFGTLLLVGSIHAQSLPVAVSGAQFTTYVEAFGTDTNFNITHSSQTKILSSPTSDEVDQIDYTEPGFNTEFMPSSASASAGLFGASDQTHWKAVAEASSQLWFSPLADQTQTVGIQIFGGGVGEYTAGSVSLLDLTSNSELWNYSWNTWPIGGFPIEIPHSNNITWNEDTTANLNVDTDFLASHQYELTITTASDAGGDSESVQIQLTGLDAVPEPSTTLFLATICGSLMTFRRLRTGLWATCSFGESKWL